MGSCRQQVQAASAAALPVLSTTCQPRPGQNAAVSERGPIPFLAAFGGLCDPRVQGLHSL